MSTIEGSFVVMFIVNILDSRHYNDTTRVILKHRINIYLNIKINILRCTVSKI